MLPLQASFLQNFAFLAPEQKKIDHQAPIDIKVDVYAFGVLAYYLLTGEFPEGIFEMPSSFRYEQSWNWDGLITACLQADPEKRPESLVEALEAIRTQPRAPANFHDFVTTPLAPAPRAQEPQEAPQPQPVYAAAKEELSSSGEEASSDELVIDIPVGLVEELCVAGANTTLRPMLKSAHIERPLNDLDPAAALVVDTAVKHYTPERREVKNIQPLQTEMVVVNGGQFYRGSTDGNRDESPRHLVTLSSYAIDTHPVTNEQFVRFLEVMGGEKDSNHQDIIRMRDSRIKRSGGRLSIESGYSKHPVVGVTWYGALAYAMWLGKRLPTEAEWEIAARGGLENDLYPTGEDIEKTQANFFSSDTTAVMSYAPNGYGLYDMAGNVYEWCHDWYGYNYYEASVQEPEDPKGPLQGVYRVLRGGCWKSLKEDLRCSRRHRNNPGTVNGTYGFRCAADVE
jgi:formylglycine-generating enzyme required for sulfatase activity